MYEHPQDFLNFFSFFFVCFSFAVLKFYGGDQTWLGAGSQLSGHSHHVPFLSHLCCFWATAWHQQLGSFHPLQESQSCRSRRLAGGGGRCASLQASPHQSPSAPKQGCALSGAGLTLGTLTAGTPDDTKGGAFFRQALEFSFASFFLSIGIPP